MRAWGVNRWAQWPGRRLTTFNALGPGVGVSVAVAVAVVACLRSASGTACSFCSFCGAFQLEKKGGGRGGESEGRGRGTAQDVGGMKKGGGRGEESEERGRGTTQDVGRRKKWR
eukprot:354663-Chlamydomonas_euryale.AAC.2